MLRMGLTETAPNGQPGEIQMICLQALFNIILNSLKVTQKNQELNSGGGMEHRSTRAHHRVFSYRV